MKTITALLLAVAACPAATINCFPVADVTTINECTLNVYTVSHFGETHSTDFVSALIGLAGAEMIGPAATLHFTVTTDPATINRQPDSTWVNLSYRVDTSGSPMDFADLQLTVGSGVVIFETICASDPAANYGACPQPDVLTSMVSWGQYSWAGFSRPESTVWVDKFIQFDDASVHAFDNGIGSAPEPGTWLLVGGMLLIGVGRYAAWTAVDGLKIAVVTAADMAARATRGSGEAKVKELRQ